MRIESILPERFEDWLQLRSQLFNDCSPEFHQQEMQWLYESHETGSFLITSDNDELVGLLELSLRNFVDGCLGCPVGYVEGIYIVDVFRGHGYARQLLEFAVEWFRERGCKDMATDAEIVNTEAQAFHRRMGFRERFRTVGFTKSLLDWLMF